jgi:hypothetical protein
VPADGETLLAPTVTCQLIDALVGRGRRLRSRPSTS